MEFIKYCIWCMLSVITSATGENKADLTLLDLAVGFAGIAIVILIYIGIRRLISVISIKISKNKADKNKNQE